MRSLLSSVAVLFLVSGCSQVLRAPRTDVAPVVASFESGVNQRTKVFDVEIPSVARDTQRAQSLTLKFGDARLGGAEKQDQVSHYTITRGGQPLVAVDCHQHQEGVRVGKSEFTRHVYECAGASWSLSVIESQDDVFTGTARFAGVELTLESTDDMEKGLPQYPSGFHVKQGGRWVGTFEYLQNGKVYLRPDLSPVERDAVLAVMVSLQSTERWFATNLTQGQSRPFGM